RASAGDDVVRQFRAGRRLVPTERLAVVAYELLIEGRLRLTRRELVGRPEARGVGRERLVGEHQGAVPVETELELGVGDQDPAGGGVLRDVPIELERRALDVLVALAADQRDRLLGVDVLVVAAGRLGRGREDRR